MAIRVLVIDDEQPIRRVIRRALEGDGYEVVDAADGAIGMRLLAEAHVDVVVTDIFMPGQDGVVTLRRIRKEFPHVKLIAMSGGDATGQLNLTEGLDLFGAVRTLSKPFTAAEVVEAVRAVLK